MEQIRQETIIPIAKYGQIRQVGGYPYFIIASHKIDGRNKLGLLKFDTLKNTMETIIPINKSSIMHIHKSLLKVRDEQGTRLFNLSEETFLKPVFDRVEFAHKGFIPAEVNYKWGIIDTTGNWLYPPKLDTKPTLKNYTY